MEGSVSYALPSTEHPRLAVCPCLNNSKGKMSLEDVCPAKATALIGLFLRLLLGPDLNLKSFRKKPEIRRTDQAD